MLENMVSEIVCTANVVGEKERIFSAATRKPVDAMDCTPR
jgi:hypothetical protein